MLQLPGQHETTVKERVLQPTFFSFIELHVFVIPSVVVKHKMFFIPKLVAGRVLDRN